MKRNRLPHYLSLIALILCFSFITRAQRGGDSTPAQAYERAINNPAFKTSAKGEGFCWQARGAMGGFISNYNATKNTEWLDAGLKYCDWLIDRLDVAPDGYKGWIGPFLSDKRLWQDVLVGDALLFEGMLDFAIIVNEDKDLKKKYGEKTMAYVESAKKNFIEKYDRRGTWIEDGPYGGYINSTKFLKADNLKEWVEVPNAGDAGISHPFNKQMDAGLVALKIHRITGEKFYWDRAEKVFFTGKSRFQYFDNHYCWNYFEPLYPGDIDLQRKRVRHGIWVHMWRSGYQAGEVSKIVEAYHHGLVFDELDMKRIINTNLNVMWNKDKVNPKYSNSNGLGADGDTIGLAQFQKAYGHSNAVKNGGELWTSLLDFDQTIRDLYEVARFKDDKQSERYKAWKKSMNDNPPSFKRKHAKGNVKVPEIKFTECKDLNCATVLPHIVPKDGKSILVCQSWVPGDLQIDLYSKSGKKMANLYSGKIRSGVFIHEWDGKDPDKKATYKGDYKIRWTINGGIREFPVVVN